ncbi:MAG: hypothetical protein JO023_03825 [Chloroflexi bacterium]|nr:hypothetical protein [Chloroflexota bacterium]
MNVLRNIVAFWYDFVVGDDWTVAVGVLVLLVVCGVLAHLALAATWLVMTLGVAVILGFSLWRVGARGAPA